MNMCPAVLIPLNNNAGIMLTWNVLYVNISFA